MREAGSFLYSILHPYYFLFHFISLSLPLGVWIQFEIAIDTDSVLRLGKERSVIEITHEGETKHIAEACLPCEIIKTEQEREAETAPRFQLKV